MLLVPEQILLLKKSLNKSNERLATYSNYFLDREVLEGEETFRSQVGDNMTDINYQIELNIKNEYENLLGYSTFLYERCFEHIDIGTKFKMFFLDEEDEVMELMLVDSLVGENKNGEFISKDSPLGMAIVGAHEGDVVYYQLNNLKIGVKIKEIITDSKAYVTRIRDKEYFNRICKAEKRAIRELLETSEDEYKKRLAITKSQKELLCTELKQIYAKMNSENKKYFSSRIKSIKYYLGMDVASLEDENSIGIGSEFTLKLFIDDEEFVSNLEMINRAVSDELDREYIERISPMGSKIYGLKEGERFTYRDGRNKIIFGTVYNIQNVISNKDINNYQYKKVENRSLK